MGRESHRRSPRRERSPARHKGSRRSRSPAGNSSSRREISPAREKHSRHARSPKRAESSSPRPHSPSPRAKRLRGAIGEREADIVIDKEYEKNGAREREKVRRDHGDRDAKKAIDKEYEKNSGREREKARVARGEREAEHLTDKDFDEKNGREREKLRHREKDPDLQAQREIGERRSARDDVGRESSRSRRERSSSPRNHRRRKHSASPANHHGHERSQSPSDRHHRSRHKSRSPPRTSKNGKQNEGTDSENADAHGDDGSLAKMKAAEEALDAKKKQQPSFELSGKLAAETNRVRGITLLFSEPPEARKPDIRWRLYVFKGGEVLNEPLYIHRQSCYLFGRERRVADIPTDHPSCSKQHAVIQYRQVEKEQPDGMLKKEVRPYLMDLGSTNGTFINDSRIEPQRYYELFEKDTIKFGNSSREYVMLHENSMDEQD